MPKTKTADVKTYRYEKGSFFVEVKATVPKAKTTKKKAAHKKK